MMDPQEGGVLRHGAGSAPGAPPEVRTTRRGARGPLREGGGVVVADAPASPDDGSTPSKGRARRRGTLGHSSSWWQWRHHQQHQHQHQHQHQQQQQQQQQQLRRRSSRRPSVSAALYPHDVECLERAMAPSPSPSSSAAAAGDGGARRGEEQHPGRTDDGYGAPTPPNGCEEGALDLETLTPPRGGSNRADPPLEERAEVPGAERTPPTELEEELFDPRVRRRSGDRDDGSVDEDSVTDRDVHLLCRCLEEGGPMIGRDDEATRSTAFATTVLHPDALDRLQRSMARAAAQRSLSEEEAIQDSSACSPPQHFPIAHVIAGAHGSGKTRLAHLAAAMSGFVLVKGRSDAVASPNQPYNSFVRAADAWCDQVAERRLPLDALRHLRRNLLRDLARGMDWEEGGADRNDDVRVLTTILPTLAPILLEQEATAQPAVTAAVAVMEPPSDPTGGDSTGASFAPGRRASISASIATATAASAVSDGRDSHNSHGVNHRFTALFRTLLRSVLSCPLDGQPVALLLDDAHWLDRASMDLLASVLTGEGYLDDAADIPHLHVILTVRNDDPSLIEASEGWQRLKEWAASPDAGPTAISVAHYDLSPLDADSVHQWLGQSLNMDAIERTSQLGSVIHRHAQGNPRSVVDICCYLQEVRLLHLDRSSSLWSWNVDDVDQALSSHFGKSMSPPRDGILNARLGLLPVETIDVLRVAACLGPAFDSSLLGLLVTVPVARALATAAARGYLAVRRTNPVGIDTASHHDVLCEFGSDQAHLACYQLVPPERRAQLHLSVGQTIWNSLQDDASLETHLFTILSQLFLSMKVLDLGRYSDKEVAASLCLHGGIRAAMSSSFRIASNYLDMGIRLLKDEGWEASYELALALHNTAAEMALCNSELICVQERIDAVFVHATSMLDTIPVVATRILSLCLGGKYEEARDLGVSTLRTLGEKFPSNITAMRLVLLFRRVNKMLQNKSNEQILRIPDMEDRTKLACMRLLHLMGTAVVNTTPEMIPYVALKMVRLTVKHGLSPFASFAFVMMGTVSQSLYGDLASALRHGQLGLRLCHRYGRKEFIPRVYGLYFGLTHVWSRPIHEVLVPLRRGYEVGLRTGDVEGAFLCGRVYCMTAVESGVPLHAALQNFQRLSDAVRNSQHKGVLPPLLCEIQAIHHLMGLSDDPLSPKGDVVDWDATLSEALASGQHMSAYAMRMTRTKICYVFNDYEQAASAMVTHFHKVPPVFSHCVGVMIVGLVALANAKSRPAPRRYVYGFVVRKVLKKLRRLSLQCPENILDKLSLVQAELLSVRGGRDAEAYERYVCALAVAEQLKAPFMIALINERTARHLMDVEDANGVDPTLSSSSPESLRFLRQAARSFEDMGAHAKVRRLREEMARRYGVPSESQPPQPRSNGRHHR